MEQGMVSKIKTGRGTFLILVSILGVGFGEFGLDELPESLEQEVLQDIWIELFEKLLKKFREKEFWKNSNLVWKNSKETLVPEEKQRKRKKEVGD